MNIENLLVTGGCGFIGSNFIRDLLARPGFTGRIINLDKLTYAGNPENLAGIAESSRAVTFSGRPISAMPGGCRRYSNAMPLMPSAILPPSPTWIARSSAGGFYCDQYYGTFNLLETARGRGAISALLPCQHRRGLRQPRPAGAFTEETPYRPNSPYSASKAASDHLVRAYHDTYGLPTTFPIVRTTTARSSSRKNLSRW